ncbi:transaldolase family protein [Actinomyces sp.]|uniref:transaldolase family protein n=1 Tax=Actinomyces sp. TaxID=29317 RepID=UPI0026DD87E9|nr:transaldolase family protein [Actinomyces sp.]MDO4899864.1 transaldolase family protein [Actinomyces sp.]
MKRAIFLDSASLRDAEHAEEIGCVGGITMNPTLLAREHVSDVYSHVRDIMDIFSGLIMYQPVADQSGYLKDALKVAELAPERICIKLPPLEGYMRTGRRLVSDGYAIALTAVTSGEQVAIAEAIDASYIIPYVSRAANDERGSDNIVGDIMAYGTGGVPVIAASVKNMRQLSGSYMQGAYGVSTSIAVIRTLLSNEMALEAMRSFNSEYAND